MFELKWNYTSTQIGDFHYKITQKKGIYTMQEFYKNNPTPNFAKVHDLEQAQALAQLLADDIMILND